MSNVSIEEALQKGKMQLMWIPMIILFVMMLLGVAILAYSPVTGISIFILSFIVPWIWWSFKVVKWKIWAFNNVADLKTLEKKAIAQQLIWPQGSWFEKTEIKSVKEKQELDWLYRKIQDASFNKELVYDNKLPIQMVIQYPKLNVYLYLLMVPLGIYLIYVNSLILGILCIGCGCWLAFDLYRKINHKRFLLKLDHKGVTLPHTFLEWNLIEEYFIERSGFGDSATFSLIIKGSDFHETILLSDINTGAFTIEKYMDVYRSRCEVLNQVGRE